MLSNHIFAKNKNLIVSLLFLLSCQPLMAVWGLDYLPSTYYTAANYAHELRQKAKWAAVGATVGAAVGFVKGYLWEKSGAKCESLEDAAKAISTALLINSCLNAVDDNSTYEQRLYTFVALVGIISIKNLYNLCEFKKITIEDALELADEHSKELYDDTLTLATESDKASKNLEEAQAIAGACREELQAAQTAAARIPDKIGKIEDCITSFQVKFDDTVEAAETDLLAQLEAKGLALEQALAGSLSVSLAGQDALVAQCKKLEAATQRVEEVDLEFMKQLKALRERVIREKS